ncbi:hypothetical protein HDU93_001321 [Gonapodya sp. JEL0774]|nr:hypothetical protein HDU93_001321 [Gonapodya sp. JEL0774]
MALPVEQGEVANFLTLNYDILYQILKKHLKADTVALFKLASACQATKSFVDTVFPWVLPSAAIAFNAKIPISLAAYLLNTISHSRSPTTVLDRACSEDLCVACGSIIPADLLKPPVCPGYAIGARDPVPLRMYPPQLCSNCRSNRAIGAMPLQQLCARFKIPQSVGQHCFQMHSTDAPTRLYYAASGYRACILHNGSIEVLHEIRADETRMRKLVAAARKSRLDGQADEDLLRAFIENKEATEWGFVVACRRRAATRLVKIMEMRVEFGRTMVSRKIPHDSFTAADLFPDEESLLSLRDPDVPKVAVPKLPLPSLYGPEPDFVRNNDITGITRLHEHIRRVSVDKFATRIGARGFQTQWHNYGVKGRTWEEARLAALENWRRNNPFVKKSWEPLIDIIEKKGSEVKRQKQLKQERQRERAHRERGLLIAAKNATPPLFARADMALFESCLTGANASLPYESFVSAAQELRAKRLSQVLHMRKTLGLDVNEGLRKMEEEWVQNGKNTGWEALLAKLAYVGGTRRKREEEHGELVGGGKRREGWVRQCPW